MRHALPRYDGISFDCCSQRRLVACAAVFFAALSLVSTWSAKSQQVSPAPPAPVQAGARSVSPSADDPAAELERVQNAFAGVVERVSPSVVGIRSQRRNLSPRRDDGSRAADQLITINGSGTIIDRNGSILTNEHVVQAADLIHVFFHDGKTLIAAVVASDPRSDLAILQTTRTDLPPARMCNWNDVRKGQWTIAIGNPFGLGGDGKLSVSTGVLSNLGRRLPGLGEADDRLYNDMIQTTAPINPGNSGGPLFNIQGELIGVVTAMHTRAGADEGVGFAIPLSPTRRRAIESLQSGRPMQYGFLGVTVRDPEGAERQIVGDSIGAIVEEVEPSGPAARADLRSGDVIVRFDGQMVRDAAQLVDQIGSAEAGRQIVLEVRRSGQTLTVRPTMDRRQLSRVGWLRGGAILWRGLRLADITPESRERMRIEHAASGLVVIDVRDGSPAGEAKLSVGDVIERIGSTTTTDVVAFRETVRGQNGAVKLVVRGRGEVIVQPERP